jgi:hypothetical protein
MLWGMLFLLGFGVSLPALGFMPLCGLYPGGIASGDVNYSMHLITLWCVLFGIIFSVLGFVAYYFRNITAAISFLALFLISSSIFIARVVAVLKELH